MSNLLRRPGQVILVMITLFVVGDLLLTRGCVTLGLMLGAVNGVRDAAAELARQQAKISPLPPHMQLLSADDYSSWLHQNLARSVDFSAGQGWLAQDPTGRYMLTGDGFYDFTTASQTPLNCPVASSPGVDLRRRWLDEQVFLWKLCVFELKTLQPGIVERVWCGPGRASCGYDEILATLAVILQQVDRAYQNAEYGEYVFVQLSADMPPHAWTESGAASTLMEPITQAGLTPKDFPSQDGRNIPFETHRHSPDGAYDARFDASGLTVTRILDAALVAQVRPEDFHHAFGPTSQHMNVAGWTDDSRQVIFLIETILHSRRSLAQIFALTIR